MLVKVRAAGLSRSVEVTILEEAVLEREPLLLSLTPLLVIKVDVGALKRQELSRGKTSLQPM